MNRTYMYVYRSNDDYIQVINKSKTSHMATMYKT
jgi:hypothetical protein